MYQVPSEEFLRQNEIKQKQQGKKWGIILVVASVIITIVLGLVAYQSLEKYSWSETTGTVTYSTYTREVTTDEARSYYDYEYTVDGVIYAGNDSENGKSLGVEQPPAEGASITVYYNPNQPSESLVNTNYSDALSDSVMWTLCCGPIFFLFGALIYFLSTRKSQV
jgi:hypothetical protein